MNGHQSHHNGGIVLEDLEQEDADVPFVSNNHYQNQSKAIKRNGGEAKRSRDTNYSNHNTHAEYTSSNNSNQTNNHLMINGHTNGFNHHRRKSISAEPPEIGLLTAVATNGHSSYPNHDGLNYLNHHSEPINGHHSSLSLSVNNAITVAPSRTTLLEPNVFAGGRPHHHHKKHNHRKHKGRSKSPTHDRSDPVSDHQSILNRIDNSILKNFGDWTNVEDEGFHHRNNIHIHNNRSNNNVTNNNNNNNCNGRRSNNNMPYYLPKSFSSSPDNDIYLNINNTDDQLNLPRLYKPYETVMKTSKQILNDKSHRIALSKDNNDPNSILSEAKRTLSQFAANID